MPLELYAFIFQYQHKLLETGIGYYAINPEDKGLII